MMFHRLGRLRVSVLCSAVLLFGIGVRASRGSDSSNNSNSRRNRRILLKRCRRVRKKLPSRRNRRNPHSRLQPRRSNHPVVTRPGQPPENIIEAIEFRGARRVRQDTLQALIFTKKGDMFDRRKPASRFHGAVEQRTFRRYPHRARAGQRQAGSFVSWWWSGRWCAPSSTTATSPSASPTSWTVSRTARWAWWSNRSTIRTKCSAPGTCCIDYWPSTGTFRHGGPADPPRSAVVARDHVQNQRRSQGQGGQHRYHGQHRVQR